MTNLPVWLLRSVFYMLSSALLVSVAPAQDRETKVRNDRRDILQDGSWHYNDLAAASAAAKTSGKPILVATELAVADPDNAGPAAVCATGRLAYPSGDRAVAALGALYRRSRHLERHRT